jgi:phosphate/sulfate permease
MPAVLIGILGPIIGMRIMHGEHGAGTMAANRSGLQMATLRNILLAWVLTIPVCVLLGAATFGAALFVVLNVLGWK